MPAEKGEFQTTVVVLASAAAVVTAKAGSRRRAVGVVCRAASEGSVASRRMMLGAAVSAATAVASQMASAESGKVTSAEVAKASAEIAALVKSDPDKGPTLVRLAWHSSGTYDKMTKTGGSGLGTIRFKEELAHGGNAGLDKAVQWLEPVKSSNPNLSYADLYTLSGIVAIKTLGGPSVAWRAGRVDSMSPKDVTPDGRLPNADNGSYGQDASHIRDIFYRMGFDDKEIVALSGAHALGRCHANASGFVGPWTPTPTTFNNAYFTLLQNLQWEEGCIEGETCKNHQYRDVGSKKLMMLPTDIALVKDPNYAKYASEFAKSEKAFFSEFSPAFSKLLELGTSGLYAV